MAPNNMRRFLQFGLVFILGALAGGFGVHYFYGQLLNYSMQMDSVADATIYVGTLKQLRSGHSDKAGEILDTLLGGTAFVLKNCDANDCGKSHEALELIESYKNEFKVEP